MKLLWSHVSHFVEGNHITRIFPRLGFILFNLLLQGVDADEEVAGKQERQDMDESQVDIVHGEHPEGLQEVDDKDNDGDDNPGGEKASPAHPGAVNEECTGDEVEGGQDHGQDHYHKGQE